MNTLIANQYGRVQGEPGGCGLTLCVTAQTPRRESVELQTRVDSIEQQLYLLSILRAVERRIEQFQLRDSKAGESAEQRVLSRRSAAKRICSARTVRHRKATFMGAFLSFSSTRLGRTGVSESGCDSAKPGSSRNTTSGSRLRLFKLGIDGPEAVIDRAFVENLALVPKIAK